PSLSLSPLLHFPAPVICFRPASALLYISPFSFYSSRAHRDLHSFPTRRSSDLRPKRCANYSTEKSLPVSLVQSPMRLRCLKNLKDRKSTRLNSSHVSISYAVFCLKKKIIHEVPIVVV